jgi:hypothetical protein
VPRGTIAQIGGLSDLVRSQSGDVALLWYSTEIGTAWFIARRAPGDTTFKPQTDGCYDNMTSCARLDGGYFYRPRLEANGSATASSQGSGSNGSSQWLSFDTAPPTVLWSGLNTQSYSQARMIRADGVPLLLTSDGMQLQIVEGGVTVQISGDAAQTADCCATFDRPGGSHVAILQNGAAPKLYVSDRVALGDWRGTATIDVSAMKVPRDPIYYTVVSLNLFEYIANASGPIIIGGIREVSNMVMSPPTFRPFAVARPAQ